MQIEYVKRKLMGAPKSVCTLQILRGAQMVQVRIRRGGFSDPTTSSPLSVNLGQLASRNPSSSGGHSSGERSNAGRPRPPIAPSAPGLPVRAPPGRPPAQVPNASRALRTVSIRKAAGPMAGGVPYCGVGLYIERGQGGCMVCGIEQGSAAEASEIEVSC